MFAAAWNGCAARTWNRHRAALRSFTSWASGPARGWVRADLAALIDRRPELHDRTRAIDRHQIEALWERRHVPEPADDLGKPAAVAFVVRDLRRTAPVEERSVALRLKDAMGR